jgi:lipid A 3-O-deacylase
MSVRIWMALGATLVAAAPTQAQSQSQAQAKAPAPVDNVSVWTVQSENDSTGIGYRRFTDAYYSNGLRIGWTSAPSTVPETLKGLATTLWGGGETRMSVDLSHRMYTGINTSLRNPPLGDRPYAGVALASLGLVQDGTTQTGLDTRSALVLGIGLVGPAAGAQGLQNGFHKFIDQPGARGWATQLRNEPLIQLTSERTWRLPVTTLGPLETDALPSLTASLGNLRTYLQTGITLRLGQGLNADFGAARIRPAVTGGDYFRRTIPFAWYVFLGADGRAVAHDLTLDGNTFVASRSVKKVPFVGELHGGLAVMAFGMRLTYTHTFTSQEFRRQRGGMHQVGSLALSVRF